MTNFKGFPKETISFLKTLKTNNNRDWFAENKAIYERAIKHSATQFSEVMAGELERLTKIAHTAKVYRIHRDIRFSKDKTPYNTHIHIGFTPEHGPETPPCWFFGLDTKRLTLGTGVFGFGKAELETYRARIHGKDGAKLAKRLAKIDCRMNEPELKRVPSGFDPYHERADLLRRKSLSVWIDYPDTKPAISDTLVAECRATFKRLKPVFDWLRDG